MGTTTVDNDNSTATATVQKPELWKEVVMWSCDPKDDDCRIPFPTAATGGYDKKGGTRTQIDLAEYDPDPTFHLEAYMKAPSGAKAYVILRNESDGSDISRSEISTSSTSLVRVRSGGFDLSGDHLYTIQIKNDGSSDGGELLAVKLLVEQEHAADTVSQILVASGDTTTTEALSVPDRTRQWRWDASEFDQVSGVYFEAVASVDTDILTASNVSLYDTTANKQVAEVEVPAATDSPTRFRSSDIGSKLTAGHEHVIRMERGTGLTGDTFRVHLARVIVVQSGFNDTLRYVDLSWMTDTTSTSFADVGYPDRYHMWEEWGGITGYFEATLSNSDGAETTTARLYNATGGTAVSGSEVSVSDTTFTRVRSSEITLDLANATYRAQAKASGSTAHVRHAWLIVPQGPGTTFDHVLESKNDVVDACTWDFTVEYVSGTSLGRLRNAKITLRGDSTTQDQIVVDGGSVAQSSGSSVSVAYGNVADHLVTTDPDGSGASTIEAKVKATCASAGIHTVQPVTYEFG